MNRSLYPITTIEAIFIHQGAVRVLKEFARDLTDSQIPRVAPVILPDMYRIFMEQDKYGVRTRTRAIEIFTTMASMICTMGESNKGRASDDQQSVLDENQLWRLTLRACCDKEQIWRVDHPLFACNFAFNRL